MIRDGVRFHKNSLGNSVFNLTTTNVITYDVVSVNGLFNIKNGLLAEAIGKEAVYCIVDKNVNDRYFLEINNYFVNNKIKAEYFICEACECSKKIETAMEFAAFCLKRGISRRNLIICIGGGVICDIGSFVANLIKRGTPYIRIPTTLLSVIDASVGVKTGINFANLKNSIGTYFPPYKVFYDMNLLYSLPSLQIKNGLSEIVKIISIRSVELWDLLEQSIEDFFRYPFSEKVVELIDYSILFMLEELQPNLYENNLRRVVDYGHEIGHPVEVKSNYELLHGEAVAIGMVIANSIAFKNGILSEIEFNRFIEIYQKAGLPISHKCISVDFLSDAIETAKKNKNGNLDLVSLERIGKPCFIESVSIDDLYFVCNFLDNFQFKTQLKRSS